MRNLPVLIKREEYLERKISGGSTSLYHISESLLAQFIGQGRGYLRSDSETIQILHRINRNCYSLYQKGYPVPKPYGVYAIPLTFRGEVGIQKEIFPAFVMEYIPEKTANDLIFDEIEEAIKIATGWINLARSQGITPGRDALSPRNILYNPQSKKVTLLDFLLWEI